MDVALRWPTELDEELSDQVHRVLHAVVSLGGAVGFLSPPDRATSDKWLGQLLETVRAGDGALAAVTVDGRIEAFGCWRRLAGEPFRHSAEVQKVMSHPELRGAGLGKRVVASLIEHARGAGLETLLIDARGNNHGAIELYESLGFEIYGRAPNLVEVGDERYDSVKMFMVLDRGPEIVLRGSRPGGPGSSPGRRDRR